MRTVINMPGSPGQDDSAYGVQTESEGAAEAVSAPAPVIERGRSSRSHPHMQSQPQPAAAGRHSPFVPLLLGALALLGWLGFQTHQLANERAVLLAAHASQQQTVDSAGKLRASLDALAADTQRMAEAGNPSAKLLVDELRKRGITINAAAPGAQRPAATK
ncbi:MAG: hypothetical protein Q8M01_01595 [Rubrivivax sp.]|nr:hypothetical protein [Rubrivivax sp.]